MPVDAKTVDTVERIAEGFIPGATVFHPIIALITTAVMAHFNATGTVPSEAQIVAALPGDFQKLASRWQSWTPSGDGTLPPPPASTTSTAGASSHAPLSAPFMAPGAGGNG